MQVFVATYSSRYGDDVQVYATAELAETARQEAARDNWQDVFPNTAAPPLSAEMADRYFDSDTAVDLEEAYSVVEREVVEQ